MLDCIIILWFYYLIILCCIIYIYIIYTIYTISYCNILHITYHESINQYIKVSHCDNLRRVADEPGILKEISPVVQLHCYPRCWPPKQHVEEARQRPGFQGIHLRWLVRCPKKGIRRFDQILCKSRCPTVAKATSPTVAKCKELYT